MSENGRQPMADVIVVLPGILGSTLTKGGKEVWGTSIGGIARNLLSLGENYRELRLPVDIGDDDPADGVVASALMPTTVMIPGFLKIDGYTGLIDFIEKRFAVERPGHGRASNLIEFPYDWRLSNRLNARRLEHVAIPALERWRKQTDNREAKLVLIGHSMGGLVARWFLECLGGKTVTRRLITLGTPYRGSINAVTTLCNGLSPGLGPIRLNLDEVVRSLPSLHQLLPTYDCLEADDGQLRKLGDTTPLPNVRSRDIADALSFHESIAAQVVPDKDYDIHALKGIEQPTAQTVKVRSGKAESLNSYNGKDRFGDGTVPRMSSHPPEWTNDGQSGFFGLQHASLAADTDAHRQIFGILTTESLSRLKGGTNLGVEIPDLIQAGEILPIFARADDGDPNLALQAELRAEDGSTPASVKLRPDGAGGYRGEAKGLPPQGYAVKISSYGPLPVNPVTGLTLVWNHGTAGV